MKKRLLAVIFSLSLYSGSASAVLLSLDPVSQDINTGEIASVNLNISGLGDFAPQSLGAFYVEIAFNVEILSIDSVSYGSFLGNPDDPFETDIITTNSPGLISLEEFSFLFDFELDAIQPDSFTLATLNFLGTNEGLSALNIIGVDLSDAIGFTIDPTLSNASIQVSSPLVVPAPAPITLLLLGLVLLLRSREVHR